MAGRKSKNRGRRDWEGGRAGFTLIELLIVIALTALLMAMLFIPLSRSLDLSQRGQAKVLGQDKTRLAAKRVARELSNAMEVYEPRLLRVWGYTAWRTVRDRPQPDPTAAPESYLVPNGLIAFRLPKHRYYCTQFDHYVTQQDIDNKFGTGLTADQVALDSCPQHPGAPLEFRPLTPQEPDDHIVIYFVGLKDPGFRDSGSGNPVYQNLLLFNRTFVPNNNFLNTYALYRVEFDPRLKPGNADTNSNGLDDRYETFADPKLYDPNFFYDASPVTYVDPVSGQSVTKARYLWWKDIVVTMIDAETADVVRWADSGGKYIPQPLVSFGPSPVDDEVAAPNREVGQYALGGSALPPDVPPLEYNLTHGNWTGRPGENTATDPNNVLPDSVTVGTGNGFLAGPHLQVLQPGTGVVFDSQDSTKRGRLLSYDSITGRVLFGVRRWDSTATPGTVPFEFYSAAIDPATFTADLSQDKKNDPNGMPSTFGNASARFGGNALIVPGSEDVELADSSGASPTIERLRRVGWTGMPGGGGLDRRVAQVDLGPEEYSIDYSTGIISLASGDATRWSGAKELRVRYSFQTNRPDDVVRVSYVTKELAMLNLGVVEYTRRRAEILPFEVSERVVVRNIKR
jgi:prepilin-type N-terminal cleavage/methylation domain-containing protein